MRRAICSGRVRRGGERRRLLGGVPPAQAVVRLGLTGRFRGFFRSKPG